MSKISGSRKTTFISDWPSSSYLVLGTADSFRWVFASIRQTGLSIQPPSKGKKKTPNLPAPRPSPPPYCITVPTASLGT